jgi:hypothetical protein
VIAAILQRRGFVRDGRTFFQRSRQAVVEEFAGEKLWRQRVPEVDALNGVGDGLSARLGALHGVAHRRGKKAADPACLTQRKQARKVVLMQARARGVMHQHPLHVSGGLNASKDGVGALGTAVNNGNLRVVRQRQLREARIARADGDNNMRHARMRQQRRYGVLKDRFIAN